MTRFTYSAGSRALTRARDKFANDVASNPEDGDVLISLGFRINTLELSPFACTMGKRSVGRPPTRWTDAIIREIGNSFASKILQN